MSVEFFSPDEILRRVHRLCNHSVAVRYLEGLLLHPNQLFHPTVLRHAEDLEYYCNDLEFAIQTENYAFLHKGSPERPIPVLDGKAIASIMKYLTYLNFRLDEGQGYESYEAMALYRKEKQEIISYLYRSLGRHGKVRQFRTMRQNDYRCVYRALKRLLETVSKSDPTLAKYLSDHLELHGKFMWRE
jgi:hypothetical protein